MQVALVSQEPVLFADTIFANIAFGCEEVPTQEQVRVQYSLPVGPVNWQIALRCCTAPHSVGSFWVICGCLWVLSPRANKAQAALGVAHMVDGAKLLRLVLFIYPRKALYYISLLLSVVYL